MVGAIPGDVACGIPCDGNTIKGSEIVGVGGKGGDGTCAIIGAVVVAVEGMSTIPSRAGFGVYSAECIVGISGGAARCRLAIDTAIGVVGWAGLAIGSDSLGLIYPSVLKNQQRHQHFRLPPA